MNFAPGLQRDGSIIDLHGNIITSEEKKLILETVQGLPITPMAGSIVDSVKENAITIITAETSSGKTTGVPKMVFGMGNVVVTQARVIAAIAGAKRVSNEFLCMTGDPSFSIGHRVGYRTGREQLSGRDSELLFVTDGLQLLRQFSSGIHPDILILDEVHIFSVYTEWLLAMVKKLMTTTKRRIRLVLMTATIDMDRVMDFSKTISKDVSSFHVPGRVYPVEKTYKKSADFFPVIHELAGQNKNVLIFMEGKQEIAQTVMMLQAMHPGYDVLPLHSELPVEEQKKALEKREKPTMIVATNVAQESLTIQHVNSVVDNGYCKVLQYDDSGVPNLNCIPVSRADSTQRAGRAGRTGPGEYFRTCDIPLEDLDEHPDGEIEQITLEKGVLISLSFGFDAQKEMKARRDVFVHNPDPKLLQISFDNLFKLGAITKDHQITRLGRELLNYPVEPHAAKMISEGIKRGCSRNMIDIAAIINHKGFLSKGQQWKDVVKGKFKQHSDLIAHRELFLILTSAKPLERGVYEAFLKMRVVKKRELDLFNQLAASDQPKMFFEVVDVEEMGIKTKRLYEILATIRKIEGNLGEGRIEIQESEDFEKITTCILSGFLNSIFSWKKADHCYESKSKGGFRPPNTSILQPSSKFKYVGSPFVIGGSSELNDLPLLSFVTKVTEAQIEEVGFAHITEEFSDVRFGVKPVARTKRGRMKLEPRVIANVAKELGGLTIQKMTEEIPKEKVKSVISMSWLPDFMIDHNLSLVKYIASSRHSEKGKEFNLERFKQILKLFTPLISARFNLGDRQKSLNSFIHDRVVFDEYMSSKIPAVVEFRSNPFLQSYGEIIPQQGGRRQDDHPHGHGAVPQQPKPSREKVRGALQKLEKSHDEDNIVEYLIRHYVLSRTSAIELILSGQVLLNYQEAKIDDRIDSPNLNVDVCDPCVKVRRKRQRSVVKISQGSQNIRRYISRTYLFSMTQVKELIANGSVYINGSQATMTQLIDPTTDTIEIRGEGLTPKIGRASESRRRDPIESEQKRNRPQNLTRKKKGSNKAMDVDSHNENLALIRAKIDSLQTVFTLKSVDDAGIRAQLGKLGAVTASLEANGQNVSFARVIKTLNTIKKKCTNRLREISEANGEEV